MKYTILNKYNAYVFVLLVLAVLGCKNNPDTMEVTEEPQIEEKDTFFQSTSQLLVAITDNWDTLSCKIYLCEKDSGKWLINDTILDGVTGKKGLAWGIGIHDSLTLDTIDAYTQKMEGDMKSPAGIFNIGTCYGYADSLPFSSSLTYVAIKPSFHGVDDPSSEFYNQIIDTENLQGSSEDYYNSFEVIKRKDNLYKWFFQIKHNPDNTPSKGSLIFFHVWRDASHGTAGCIATSEENILSVLQWLNSDKSPKIIILPKNVYIDFQQKYDCPQIF